MVGFDAELIHYSSSPTQAKRILQRDNTSRQLPLVLDQSKAQTLPPLLPFPFKINSCLFQHIIFCSHHTTVNLMTFRQFTPNLNFSSPQAMKYPFESHQNSQLLPQVSFPWLQCDYSRALAPSGLAFPLKKRRNIKLSLKPDPSDDKIRKINERKGRYKRSTNNSHKKFICVAKRLLSRLLDASERQSFDNSFQAFKSSRTYYFIILAHAKILLSPQNLRDFIKNFRLLMCNKIDIYRKEIQKADNRNFITFRLDEIADIQYALQAYQLYFEGNVEEAVETIYKREKTSVLKKRQCEISIGVVKDIESELEQRKSGCQSQNVIVLQHNHYMRELMSQERVQQKEQLEKNQANDDQGEKQLLMIGLENSYPIYEYFYEVMFPYTITPNPLPTPQNTFPFNFNQPSTQNPLFPALSLSDLPKPAICKTATEDQSPSAQ